MSNPEIAINFEKEHLRSAEECDYMVLENLIQRRYDEDEENEEQQMALNAGLLSVVTETGDGRLNLWHTRSLQRSSAVESDAQLTLGM